MKLLVLLTCVAISLSTFAQTNKRLEDAKKNGSRPFLTEDVPDFQSLNEAPDKKYCLWYTKPAKSWNQALPFGNGAIGGMTYGGIKKELLTLNENTIWGGPPVIGTKGPAKEHIDKARKLLFEGKIAEAENLLSEKVISKSNMTSSYQYLGLLELNIDVDGKVTDYQRELDLETAVASVQYKVGTVNFKRETFASAIDNVIVVHLSADKPGSISFDLSILRDSKNDLSEKISVEGNSKLVMTGQAVNTPRKDAELDFGYTKENTPLLKGVKFESHYQVVPVNGDIKAVKDCNNGYKLVIINCDEAFIYISVATNYNQKNPYQPHTNNLGDICESTIKKVVDKDYVTILKNSVEAHKQVFNRVDLQLGESKNNIPTDERIASVTSDKPDTGLEALLYQYGRYLLICSSRPGTQTMGLQGIWASGTSCPWNGDYHVNINQQMNYWGAETGNLSEFHEPFFDLIENLIPTGSKFAKETYGCNGFMSAHTTDAYYFVANNGKLKYCMWVVGGAWCSRHFMEHYYYTGDKEFLKERAFPVLKESCVFLLDWLVEDPRTGKLVSRPTSSPENNYLKLPEQKTGSVCMGPAMDQEIIWENFNHYLEAAKELSINDEFTNRVKDALKNLQLPKIGKDGRILEWSDELLTDSDPGHRHMSHVYGLFPSKQFNWKDSPDYFAAARKSIEGRLAHQTGQIGWSRAWIINFWARLLEGEKAHESVVGALTDNMFQNLFNVNPPFIIDGNFGYSSGIGEMLIQSHLNEVHLLPAIPKAWNNGKVKGLCARGGFEVEMKWENGKLTSGKILSKLGNKCTVTYGETTKTIDTKAGSSYSLKILLEL